MKNVKIFDDFIISYDNPEFKGYTVYFISMSGDIVHFSSNFYNARKYCSREAALFDSEELKNRFDLDCQVVKLGG